MTIGNGLIKVGLILLVALFVLDGCSDANKPDKKLIGVWKLIESYQISTEHPNKLNTMISDFTTEFLSDKTFVQPGGWSGHWNFLDDGRLKLTFNQYGRVDIGKLQGSRLVFEDSNGRTTNVAIWEKIK